MCVSTNYLQMYPLFSEYLFYHTIVVQWRTYRYFIAESTRLAISSWMMSTKKTILSSVKFIYVLQCGMKTEKRWNKS